MTKDLITKLAQAFVADSSLNYIKEDLALDPQLAGMKIFEEPLFAYGSAHDSLFRDLKNPAAVGEQFILPVEWLPQANTVISYFFPFTDQIKISNRSNQTWPSNEWLHGRIEGQQFLNEFTKHLNTTLQNSGYLSLVPTMDPRFWAVTAQTEDYSYTSNWSERHVGFVCGLGTFGLSKGLITTKGMAGRIGSILTNLTLDPTPRYYTDLYENCSMCGSCISQCPVGAISLETGKNHTRCANFLDEILKIHAPRYGCGKCQVAVPCEGRIPLKFVLS